MAKKETKRGGDAVPESTTKKKSRSFPTVTPSKKKGRKGPPTVKPKKKKSSSATSVKGGDPEAVSKDTEQSRDIKDTPYAPYGPLNPRRYVLSNRLGGSVDPLMQAMSRFWTSNENSLIFSIEDVPFKLESKRSGLSNSLGKTLETFKAIPEVFDTGIGDMSIEAGNIDSLRKTSEFFEALNTIQYSAALPAYEVYNFTQRCPIQYPSYHDNNSVVNADVSFIYNYELKNYEELTSPASFNETQCLNFYIDYEKIADAYVRTLSDLRKTSRRATASGGRRAKPVLSKNSRSQFDKELQSETAGNGGAENVIISDEMLENMRARNEALEAGKISLPFYVKIDIDKTIEPPDNITDVNEIIFEDGSIFVDIATYCADITSPTSKADYSSRKSFTNSNWTATYSNEEQTKTELSFGLQSNNLTLIDALAMSTNLIDNTAASSSPPTKQIYAPAPIKKAPTKSGSAVSGYTSTSTPSTSTTSAPPTKAAVINYTGLEDLHDELESMLKMEEFHYYYSDLLANASRPSTEIIMYRIAKYESENSLLPIQNIWLPRKDDKRLSYIDFQVKYGKRYVYKIFAYKFIVGTTYSLTVSNPTDNSYFGKIVEDYYEMRNALTIEAIAKNDTFTHFTIDEAIGGLIDDLKEIIEDPKNRISNAKENLKSTKPKSQNLRATLRALMAYLQGRQYDTEYDDIGKSTAGTIGSTTSTFDKTQRKIEKDISGIVASSSTGGYITADVSGVDTDTKAELQSILDIMNEFEDMGDSLITTLRNILSSKEGLHDGTSKKNQLLRQSAANVLKSTIELFLDKEEEMIDALLGVTSNEVKKGFTEGTKIITAVTFPHIDLVEFPYYSDAGTILDNPPVFPDVNFVPYKGVDSKIGLFLNSGIGLDILKPINVSPQDQAYIDLFREARKYNGLEPIAFKSDESKNMAATFEIYRLKMAPKSYADFENIGVHAVVAEKFKGGLESLPSVSYMDSIHPNQAYYYMFRSIDERGNRSNPSQVFSLTMVNENGLVFPLINHYEFPPPPTNYTKQFKKLLNLAPSINQVSFEGSEVASYEAYRDKNNINGLLGVNKQGIFGKTFKIRVTSKKTGKQLDLNVTFDSQIE